jgi:hypothetical protein
MPGGFLDGTQIGAYGREISAELLGMFHSPLPHFLDNRISHRSASSSSSGEQISGQGNPSFSTICLIIIRVNGLFMCAKFHVTRASIPLTAATAM